MLVKLSTEQLHLEVVKLSADQHSVVAQEVEPQRAVRPIEVLEGAARPLPTLGRAGVCAAAWTATGPER